MLYLSIKAEDARCAMLLYIKDRDKWEKELRDHKNAARNKADNIIIDNNDISISQQHQNDHSIILNNLNNNDTDNDNNDNQEINMADCNNTETIIIRESKKNKKNIPLANISLLSPTIDIEVEVLNGINDSDNIINKENKRKISSRGFINIPNKNIKKIQLSNSMTILNNNISNDDNNNTKSKNNKIKSQHNSMFETNEYAVFGLGKGNAKNIKSISDINKMILKKVK